MNLEKLISMGCKKVKYLKQHSMKTPKYISNGLRFLKSFNTNAKGNLDNEAKSELTIGKFGFNLKQTPKTGKTSNSLLSQLYSEENETLFI